MRATFDPLFLNSSHVLTISSYLFIRLMRFLSSGDSYIVSGDSGGELKVWSTNGDSMGSFSHGQCITALRSFQDNLGGQPGNHIKLTNLHLFN